jgi:hypothetical protein
MKTTILATIAIALVLPATALAGGQDTSPSAVCRTQRAQLGVATFNATYGTQKNAFARCVAKQVHVQDALRRDALKQCQAERDDAAFALSHGGKTFEQFYAGNKNNALRNCVSAKSSPAILAASQHTLNAAQQCRAQRTSMGARDFGLLYGTGPKHANAFGKCVSKLERAAQADEDNASQACKAEQADPAFAVSHGGKTFADFYGRNADKSDAFGNCVSTKAQAAAAARQTATLNASQTCKGERAANPAAFKAKYGKNRDRSDAFGRCVAAHAGD